MGAWYRLPKDQGFRMGGHVGADRIGPSTVEASLRIGSWELGLPVAFADETESARYRKNLNPAVVGGGKLDPTS
jgi:hypothetical protein